MKKVYVFAQDGYFWNKDIARLVDFEKATLFTQDEFLDHVQYIDKVNGKWIEISENGIQQIDSKESLVDEIVCEMRKWDREQLMNYITDCLDKIVSDQYLRVMYTDLVLEKQKPTPAPTPSYYQPVDTPKENDVILPKKWGFQPCCEKDDNPPVEFPEDGIMGEVRTLSDGKQYRYSGGIWLPVAGFNGPRNHNTSDTIKNSESDQNNIKSEFPQDVSLGHIYQAHDGNMYSLTKAGWLEIGNPPGTLDQYW